MNIGAIENFWNHIYNFQKQPLRGVSRKRCYENMQQIYRRTLVPKSDFNKVALQFYWNHISSSVFSCKFAAYFQNTFSWEHLWVSASEFLDLGTLQLLFTTSFTMILSFCFVLIWFFSWFFCHLIVKIKESLKLAIGTVVTVSYIGYSSLSAFMPMRHYFLCDILLKSLKWDLSFLTSSVLIFESYQNWIHLSMPDENC